LRLGRAEDTARLEKLGELFACAVDLPPDARMSFVERACAEDGTLRKELVELLECHDRPLAILAGDAPEGDARSTFPSAIGPYDILGLLGSGGMGVVYRAEQRSPRRPVALKVLHPGVVHGDARKRFAAESAVLGLLEHPGIARIYDAGVCDVGFGEMPYFAMELVEGLPLTRYAAEHRLDARQRLTLVAHVCDAVQHAHERGVIHRDLKPGNVLVRPPDTGSQAPQPKVLDFGIARTADAGLQMSMAHTATGQLLGTLPYMSPEQIVGDGAAVDVRSDVYSLGVMLYELLAGRVPLDFSGLPLTEVARLARDEEPTTLGRVDRALRGDIETICARALAKERDRRYGSASALAADLRRFLLDEPILARRQTRLYQFRKFARRHKALVGGVSTTFAALVLGMVGMTIYAAENRALAASEQVQRGAAERARDALRLRLYEAQMIQGGHAVGAPSGHASIRRILDRWVPSAGETDVRGWEWRVLRAYANPGEAELATESTGGTQALWWSADGQHLIAPEPKSDGAASTSASRPAGRTDLAATGSWDASTGRFTGGLTHVTRPLALDRDGRLFAQPRHDGLEIVDAASGTVVRSWPSLHAPIAAGFDPTGRLLAVVCGALDAGEGRGLVVLDVASGRRVADLGAHGGFQPAPAFSADGRLLAAATYPRAQVLLFDTASWRLDRTIEWSESDRGSAHALVWHPHRPWLAIKYRTAGSVGVFDAESGEPIRVLAGQRLGGEALDWSADGRWIVAGGGDESVWVWDATSGKGTALGAHDSTIARARFAPDGERIASIDCQGIVRIWRRGRPPAFRTLQPAGGSMLPRGTRLTFRADGRLTVLPLARHTSTVLDPVTGAVLETVDGRDATWSPDGRFVAAWRDDRIVVLRAGDGLPVAERAFGASGWPRLAWHPRTDRLAVGCARGLWLWDPLDPAAEPLHTSYGGNLHEVLWRPDGAAIAVCCFGDRLGVLDPANGTVGESFAIGRNFGFAWAPSGTRFAVGGQDHFVRVYETTSGERVAEWNAHDGQIYSLAWSHDGKRIATGGTDDHVRVFDAASGAQVLALRYGAPVSGVAWSPDDSMLASCSEDGEVRVADATERR